jgi:imidazole glycerol phosphate synthase glutamine amidotransferase subunit
MTREVLVVQTGTANIASVLAGLGRVGARPVLVNDPDRLLAADRVVLPGVGALAAAMDRLESDGLTGVLRSRVDEGRPTLAICLGLQLLCRRSEESPGTAGLGAMDADVSRFSVDVTVPQMGWNRVVPGPECRYLKPGFAYFANSFRVANAPAPWQTAWTEYDGPFVAAAEKGDVLACQFHPELSGAWGEALLAAWLEGRPAGGTSC